MSAYKLRPGVRWVVERFGIVLTDGSGVARTLPYPQAAIWDLFSRGYAFEKTVSMMCHIAEIDEAGADGLVRAAVAEWLAGGLLEQV